MNFYRTGVILMLNFCTTKQLYARTTADFHSWRDSECGDLDIFNWGSSVTAGTAQFIFSGFQSTAIARCISSALQLPFATFDLLQMRDTAGQAHKLGNARPRREHLICMIRATSFVDIIQTLERLSSLPFVPSTTIFVTNFTTSGFAFKGIVNEYFTENPKGTSHFQINSNIYFVFHSEPNSCANKTPACSESGRNSQKLGLVEFYCIKSTTFFNSIRINGPVISFRILSRSLRRRENFKRNPIAAAAQQSAWSDNEVKFAEGSNMTYAEFDEGVAVDMYRDLRDMLNFTEKALIGSSVGIKDGKTSGLTYDLLSNGSADISISEITVKEDRAEVLQFLQPTLASARIKAIFSQPRLSDMRNIFLAPFTFYLWVTIALAYGILIASMTGFALILIRSLGTDGIDDCNQDDGMTVDSAYIYDSWIVAIASLCQKGWSSPPVSFSLRGIFFTGCATSLIIYAAYSAVIIATLSVEQVPVKSFKDLLTYKYKFYAHELSYTMQKYVQIAIINTHNLSQPVLTTNTENELRILAKSSKALISYEDVFYSAVRQLNFTEKVLCKWVSTVPVDSSTQKMAMFLRKGSPLQEFFNYKIIAMKERGFMARYLAEYMRKTQPVCGKVTGVETHELDMPDVYVAFAVLGAGVGLSLAVIMFERLACGTRASPEALGELYFAVSITLTLAGFGSQNGATTAPCEHINIR